MDRHGNRFKIHIKALTDVGLDKANAVLEVMELIRVVITGGSRLHRSCGERLDSAAMSKVSVDEDMAVSSWGSDDSTVSSLMIVLDGMEPRMAGDELRKRSKQSSVDKGIATNKFGEVNTSCKKPVMSGLGREPNACRLLNVDSMLVAADNGRMVRTEGCCEAIVIKALIRVMGRMESNAVGEDAIAVKNDVVRDGETCARKFGDEANLDTSVSRARLGIASSTHGTEATTLSSRVTSVGSSA